MNSSSEEEDESLDYIQLIPFESYPFEKARHRTTIKWLLSRAYSGYSKIPEDLKEPFYEDDEGLPHLKPPIVMGLSTADLYTRSLHNLYRDPNYSNLSPWGVVQLLTRKGVYLNKLEDGSCITETMLIQSNPLKMAPHLILIESLQQLYVKELLYRRSRRPLPSDVEEALLLYINEVVMGVKEEWGQQQHHHHHHYSLQNKPTLSPKQLSSLINLQPYQDLADLSDGVGLCLLLAHKKIIQLERIILPNQQGEHLNVAEALTNLQLFKANFETCFQYEDLLYMDKSVRQGVVCLLAEMYAGGGGGGSGTGQVEQVFRDITPTKRKNLDTNPGVEPRIVGRKPPRDEPTMMVQIESGRGGGGGGGGVRQTSHVLPAGRSTTTTSGDSSQSPTIRGPHSKRSNSSPPRSLQYGGGGETGSYRSQRSVSPPSMQEQPRGTRSYRSSYGSTPRQQQQPQPYTSTSSSSSGEFQVQSRKRTPLLRNHAAGLPSTPRPGTSQHQEPIEESITGRKRISRSNSLTEIDSQLTVENFGGGVTIDNRGRRDGSSSREQQQQQVQSYPTPTTTTGHQQQQRRVDLFATRDLFSGEEPIDRLRSSRESGSYSSEEYGRSMDVSPQQQQKSYYATVGGVEHHQDPVPVSTNKYQQQDYEPPPSSIQPLPPHHHSVQQQKYYSLPREPPPIQIYSSPQHQQHFLSSSSQQPINIVYLGGQPQPPTAREQEQEDLAELEQIEELRRRLEEKKRDIERLRMKRIVQGGRVGLMTTGGSGGGGSFHLHQNSTESTTVDGGASSSSSFHLHSSLEETPPLKTTSFYLNNNSSPDKMTSSDPTVSHTKSIYVKQEPVLIREVNSPPPVPPPRRGRVGGGTTGGGPVSMEPQSISFVQETATPRSITSGTKTYRIQTTPDSSISSGGRPPATELFQQKEEDRNGGGFFIELQNSQEEKENHPTTTNSNEEDILEKKRQRILLQSLRRQQEAEELKRKKEEELERRRELELDKAEQARRKKEEERMRREKILEGYRMRKGVEAGEVEPPEQPAPSSVRFRPKSANVQQQQQQRPKSIHSMGGDYGGRLQRSESQSSMGKFGARPQPRQVSAPPPSQQRNVWGSTTSLNKYNRFGVVRSSRFGGSARSLVESGEESPTHNGGTSHPSNRPELTVKFCPSSLSSGTTPHRFQQKSNRLLITNAFEYSIFPGHVNHEQKTRILEEINASESKYFLVLFRDAGLQFRGLYAVRDEDGEEIVKLYGTGPKLIRDEMFDLFYKYNSGSKSFTSVHTRHLTVTIDAFTIQNALWQKRAVGSGGHGRPGRDY